MSYSVNLFTLEDRLNGLREEMRTKAEALARSNSFTAEGKIEKWDQTRTAYFDRLQDLRGDVNAVKRGIDNMLDYARAAAVGTPPDPAAPDVAAELATARILNRRTKWEMNTITAELNKLLGTPTAALLIEELIARGHADEDTIDALIESIVPAVSEARVFQQYAKTAMANVFDRLIKDLDELDQRGPLAPGAASPSGTEEQYRVTLATVFGTGPAIVTAEGKYTYDMNKLGGYRG